MKKAIRKTDVGYEIFFIIFTMLIMCWDNFCTRKRSNRAFYLKLLQRSEIKHDIVLRGFTLELDNVDSSPIKN